MIHLNCREHLPCALDTIDQLRRVNQQQADGWIETHNEVTQLRDENAELRRRLGEVGA